MDQQLRSLDRVFKALADPTRVRILALLLAGEVCVCDIHGTLRIPQPKASRHLAYLRRAGLVVGRKRGLWVYYRLAARRADTVQTIVDAVHHCITHLGDVRRDAARLEKTTGVIAAAPPPAPTFQCCAGGAASLEVEREAPAHPGRFAAGRGDVATAAARGGRA